MDVGMTKARYYDTCEAMGDEIDPSKVPPDYSDFPGYAQVGVDIFNALPDTFSGGMTSIFAGKDLSAIQVMFDMYLVADEDRLLVFEVISLLDNRSRDSARKAAEREAKRSNRK